MKHRSKGLASILAIVALFFVQAACSFTGNALAIFATETPTPTLTPEPTSTATPTFTPEPTETLTPTVTPTQVVLYTDDFSDRYSGWEIALYGYGDEATGFDQDSYYIMTSQVNQIMWGAFSAQEFGDQVINIDVRLDKSAPNNNTGYGVVCRGNGYGSQYAMDTGYLFLVTADGYGYIGKLTDDDFIPLTDVGYSDRINQGLDTNHITAVCHGSDLSLYVNGDLIAEGSDGEFTSGRLSLFVIAFESGPVKASFDNLVITEPR